MDPRQSSLERTHVQPCALCALALHGPSMRTAVGSLDSARSPQMSDQGGPGRPTLPAGIAGGGVAVGRARGGGREGPGRDGGRPRPPR